jgi:allantoin racemase
MKQLAVIIPGELDAGALGLRVRHMKRFAVSSEIVPLIFKGTIRGIKTGGDVSLLAQETMELAIQAEKTGCDAVVIHGICDFGLEAARGAVDIPVVGLGSAVFHLACQLGDRIGVVSKSDATIPEFTRRIQLMGCADRMTSMRPLNIAEQALADRNQELEKRFIEIAEYQITHEGAEVIVAGYSAIFGVLPERSREEIEECLGVPVLDGVPIAIRTAEMLVDLKLMQSRKAYPRRV